MEIEFEAILQVFAAESAENLSLAEESLLALEEAPHDAGALQTVFRVVHTIKGDGANLGFAPLAAFAHAAEDVLDGLREGALAVTPAVTTLLLESVDALRSMVRAATAGGEWPRVDALAAGLAACAAGRAMGGGWEPASSSATDAGRADAARRAATLRVPVERLDRLLNLAGEIVIARGRLAQALESGDLASAAAAHAEADPLYADLQELVTGLRMVPVGPLFRSFHRTVRDLAAQCGKQARLVTEGEDVEVDTALAEHLRDPLLHMVRNAVDHGLETPDERRAAGKSPVGTVTLRAQHDAAGIAVEVADDGAGLNAARIVADARRRGVLGPREQPADEDAFRLIFHPGLSTADAVTELSGRGVGMDVVRRNVEALRGSVRVHSAPGAGTTLTLRLPLTLAIIDGFHVGAGDGTYVVPLDAVTECLALPDEARGRDGATGVLQVRGEALPFVRLRGLFGMDGEAPRRESVVVLRHDARRVGLVVDALHGASQTVIKPLGQPFGGTPGLSGATILGSGRVGLILDVPALLRRAGEPRATHSPLRIDVSPSPVMDGSLLCL